MKVEDSFIQFKRITLDLISTNGKRKKDKANSQALILTLHEASEGEVGSATSSGAAGATGSMAEAAGRGSVAKVQHH